MSDEANGHAEPVDPANQGRESELQAMFDAAAKDLTAEDFAERELLIGAFANRD